jgi:LemA protein
MSRNLIFILLAVLLLGWGGCSYNGFVGSDENVKNAWGQVQSSYQRRADLYNTVVETVKGEAKFEQTTLSQVIEARAKATSMTINAGDLTPEKLAQYQQSQAQLSGAFGRLMAVSEAYPQLQTTKAFQDFISQQEGTENRIKVARDNFNKAVQEYNTRVRRLPGSLLAGIFGFPAKDYTLADPGTDKVPQVKFD